MHQEDPIFRVWHFLLIDNSKILDCAGAILEKSNLMLRPNRKGLRVEVGKDPGQSKLELARSHRVMLPDYQIADNNGFMLVASNNFENRTIVGFGCGLSLKLHSSTFISHFDTMSLK